LGLIWDVMKKNNGVKKKLGRNPSVIRGISY
jgi:hypothetical protein